MVLSPPHFFFDYKNVALWTSLVVQWLRLPTPKAGGPGSSPGRGTRSHMRAAAKSSHDAAKTWHSQINKIHIF